MQRVRRVHVTQHVGRDREAYTLLETPENLLDGLIAVGCTFVGEKQSSRLFNRPPRSLRAFQYQIAPQIREKRKWYIDTASLPTLQRHVARTERQAIRCLADQIGTAHRVEDILRWKRAQLRAA